MAQQKAFPGEKTIKSALQLIRYDIPVLILGKSSIGKSYTLIDITKKWNMPHSLLYIGSEKSENIEGVPKLTQRKEGKEILEYLQPYWFPNADVTTQCVKRGRELFEDFVKKYWSDGTFKYSFNDLHSILNALSYEKWKNDELKGNQYTKEVILVDKDNDSGLRTLNSKKFKLIKIESKKVKKTKEGGEEIPAGEVVPDEYFRDDLRDFCLYLTTCLGYGNFWLILDEIDKVEQHDKDKFAPLLHIVRERTLKNFRMIDINNGEGLKIPFSVKEGSEGYKGICEVVNKSLEAGESVLDTRVMAIANKTKNIEEALFRRFVQLIAEEVMIWRESDIPQRTSLIEDCLVDIKSKMRNQPYLIQDASLFVPENLIQRISEINLQWQYNFLPKMLNTNDKPANFFYNDLLIQWVDSQSQNSDWNKDSMFTSLYNLLSDNYTDTFKNAQNPDFPLPKEMFDCLIQEWLQTGDEGENVLSDEKLQEGISKEIDEIVKQQGNLKLAAEYIANKLSDSYDTFVENSGTGATRTQGLHSFTDEVLKYLKAIFYDSNDVVTRHDISEFLLPLIVNVFYVSIGQDQENQVDGVKEVTLRFQSFFSKLNQDAPSNLFEKFKCDKETTQIAFYGGTTKSLKELDEEELNNAAYYSLFGNSNLNLPMSARGGIAKQNFMQQFPTIFMDLYKDNPANLTKFLPTKEYEDIGDFLREYYQDELQIIADAYANSGNKDSITLGKVIEKIFLS